MIIITSDWKCPKCGTKVNADWLQDAPIEEMVYGIRTDLIRCVKCKGSLILDQREAKGDGDVDIGD